MNKFVLGFLFCSFQLCAFDSFGQVKPNPETDELAIAIYIHGIKSKEDVEKVQEILYRKKWVKFVQVERFPQKHTEIIIKNYVTPEMINEQIKSEGFYIINKSFSDKGEIEKCIVESRKMNGYQSISKGN
jgi:hypothetical protein